MQGLISSCPAGKIVEAAKQEGLLLLTAGAQVVRLLPPLIITEKEIDEMEEKLEKALLQVDEKEVSRATQRGLYESKK